jgi:tetratricopeptide (TPR) repeat protein
MTDSSTMPGAVPAIWGKIPQRNKNFTGRVDVLARLRKEESSKITAVLPGEPLPHALQGLGGVGKTAVAIEYAHRYRGDYDLVWWIPSDQPALVRSSLAALAKPLGLEAEATATGIEGAATAVLDALRRGEPFSRWLLIFDNADQPEDLNEYIPRGPGDVLITSRNHRWQSVIDTVQVDVFIRAESKEFLTKRVPKGVSETDASKLAEKLGDLPLALEQAGAMLAETGMPVEEYLRLLDEHVTQIMAEGKSPEYPMSMTAAWKLSVTTLRQQLPQAQELLRLCAFFGPDPIPHDVFRRRPQTEVAAVSELIEDPILLSRAIRELGRFALVKIDGRAISVHRLIQALLRDELSPGEQASLRHQVHLILVAGTPGDVNDSELWPRYEELLAHVGADATELAACRLPEVREFALDVLRYLYLRGDFASCAAFTERFIKQWTEDSGPEDPHVLGAQHQRSNVLRQLGQFPQARRVVEETLEIARKAMGERDQLTLSLRNSLGADLRAHGEFTAARALDDDTRKLHEQVFGPDDPRTLRMMNNLALDYGLNSNYAAARDLHQQVFLLQSEAKSGVSSTEVLGSWNGLARAVRLIGNYYEARDVGEDALDYGLEQLGPEHYWSLRALKDLSISLRRVGNSNDTALEMAVEVYEQCGRLLGEENPDTMAAAIGLCNIRRTIGQVDEALALAERTVAIYPRVYGKDHPYNHGCASNLALMLRVKKDSLKAFNLNESCLKALDGTLTRDHHYSLTVATNLASDLAALGEAGKARALGEDTLVRLRRLLGENHPLTLGCAANLTIDLRADGVGDEAEILLADTVRRYDSSLGGDHPDTVAAREGRRLDFDFDPPPI